MGVVVWVEEIVVIKTKNRTRMTRIARIRTDLGVRIGVFDDLLNNKAIYGLNFKNKCGIKMYL